MKIIRVRILEAEEKDVSRPFKSNHCVGKNTLGLSVSIFVQDRRDVFLCTMIYR